MKRFQVLVLCGLLVGVAGILNAEQAEIWFPVDYQETTCAYDLDLVFSKLELKMQEYENESKIPVQR